MTPGYFLLNVLSVNMPQSRKRASLSHVRSNHTLHIFARPINSSLICVQWSNTWKETDKNTFLSCSVKNNLLIRERTDVPSQDSVNCILAGKELSLHPPSAFHAEKQSRSLSPVKNSEMWIPGWDRYFLDAQRTSLKGEG